MFDWVLNAPLYTALKHNDLTYTLHIAFPIVHIYVLKFIVFILEIPNDNLIEDDHFNFEEVNTINSIVLQALHLILVIYE